jgi:hypothetical protein
MDWWFWLEAVLGAAGSCALIVGLLAAAHSVRKARALNEQAPELAAGKQWPKLSVIVPACDEAHTMEAAFRSLAGVDYPNLEIILVNDRSTDQTGDIIDRLSQEDSRVLPVHITELPEGWLGKLHAMHQGTTRATGDFFLYTDADIHFSPTSLRRAVAWMEQDQLGHLTLVPRLKGHSLLYNAMISCFGVLYLLAVRAWRIGKNDSDCYGGVGAFSMVRRADFERGPGWTWLKMEVGDDIGLGLAMVREAGATSMLGLGSEHLAVDWYSGLGALVSGLEKNSYGAICGYSPPRTIASILLLVGLFCGPFFAALSSQPLLWVPPILLGLALLWSAESLRRIGQPFGATLLAGLGLPVMAFALARSMFKTEKQRGIIWRGQFYPLAALKEGRRVDL